MSDVPATTPCPHCQARDRRIAALEAEVADLRRLVDELQRRRRRQATPFRRRQRVAQPKKPGRADGHAPAHRPPPGHVDCHYHVPLPECPHCHGPVQDKAVHTQYQTDLPPVRPVVTRFDIERGYCPHCRLHVQARHPEQISDALGAAANQIGPRAVALAAEMKYRLGVPFRKIARLLADYWQLPLCHGTLVRASARLARLAQPAHTALVTALRDSPLVHGDDTGWRIGGASAWLWVYTTGQTTVFVVAPGRGHEVTEGVLGSQFAGCFVGDGAKAFDALPYVKQRCLQHILRRCHDLQQAAPRAQVADVGELKALLQEAIALGQHRASYTARGYDRRVQTIEQRLDGWLDNGRRRRGPEVEALEYHLRSHRGELLYFLEEPRVPPTNNRAEQALRWAVPVRKTGGCNKTPAGAGTFATLSSLFATMKQRGQQCLHTVVGWLRAGQAEPVPP